uniref:Uncharacterized protein n=1 Tax=Siphoviridae sp. ctBeL15 TaxID=2825374 RepID=A0A8S5V029_9CAUD|nr:MAG TPA: hypothetical protein [Siphoviridae sp. ctBeL15]
MGLVLSCRISFRKSLHFFVARTKNIRIALHIFLMQKPGKPARIQGKTRNHKGCGSFTFMVELRGVEPLKMGLNPA